MNISLLREKMLSNWKEKLVCFAMAIAVFAYYQSRKFEKESYTVPLEIRASTLLTVKSGFAVNQQVKVTLKADKGELTGINSAAFNAYIDLSLAQQEGSYNFPVNVETASWIADKYPIEISVEPKFIRVEVEEEIVRYLPVSVNVPGEPAYGYEVDRNKISVNPSFIEIRGPKRQVEKLTTVQTEPVVLDGATKDVNTEVGFLDPLSLEPSNSSQKLSVYVPIIPRISKRVVTGVEIIPDYIPPSIDIALKTRLIDVTFQGEQLELDKIKAKDCAVILNCSTCRVPDDYSLSVWPEAPNNRVSVADWSVQRVDVSARWKPEEYTGEETTANYTDALP